MGVRILLKNPKLPFFLGWGPDFCSDVPLTLIVPLLGTKTIM